MKSFVRCCLRTPLVTIPLAVSFNPNAVAEAIYDPVLSTIREEQPTTSTGPPGGSIGSVGTLYGVNITTDHLLSIDPSTGLGTPYATVGTSTVGGLAYDPVGGMFFATDSGTGMLLRIDPVNGATTIVGHTGQTLLHGLAMHPVTGELYASKADGFNTSTLWRISTSNAATTLVGSIGFISISALDFDPTTGLLYGARGGADATGQLVIIDPATAAGTLVGNTTRLNGLAFGPGGELYGEENGGISGGVSQLYRIDKASAAATLVGPIVTGNVLAIQFEFSGSVPTLARSWGSLKARYAGETSRRP